MGSDTRFIRFKGMIQFVAVALAILFIAILPLGKAYGTIPGPDLLLVCTMVWILRQPDSLPVWLVAVLFLLADMLQYRPPGLMAAAVVLACEYLRWREDLTIEVPFVLEWGVAAAIMASVHVGTAAIMVLFALPAPSLGNLLVILTLSVLCYPLAVFVARSVFGVQRRKRSDVFKFGQSR